MIMLPKVLNLFIAVFICRVNTVIIRIISV